MILRSICLTKGSPALTITLTLILTLSLTVTQRFCGIYFQTVDTFTTIGSGSGSVSITKNKIEHCCCFIKEIHHILFIVNHNDTTLQLLGLFLLKPAFLANLKSLTLLGPNQVDCLKLTLIIF